MTVSIYSLFNSKKVKNNIAIRIKQDIMDVFINGEIKKRHKFGGIPKQTYGPVYVNMNGGLCPPF